MSIKKYIVIGITIISVFILSFSILFTSYKGQLDETFDNIALKNIESYNYSIKTKMESTIENIHNTMNTMASLTYQDNTDIKNNLDKVNKTNPDYHIQYATLETLKDNHMSDDIIQTLKKIESNNIFLRPYQLKDQPNNTFMVVVPILNNNQLQGILYTEMPIFDKDRDDPVNFLNADIEYYIMNKNGDNVILESINMIDSLKNIVDDTSYFDDIMNDLSHGNSHTRIIYIDQEKYFLSYTSIDYNDWFIYSLTQSSQLNAFASTIIDETSLLTIIVFIGMGLALMSIFYIFYLSQKKQDSVEKRFQLLAEFSDIVIAEYNIKKDLLKFSSNAQKMLALDKLVFKNFRQIMSSLSLIHPDDYELVKHSFQNIQNNEIIIPYEIRMKFYDGEYHWCRINYALLFDKNHKVTEVIFKIADYSQQHEKLVKLEEMAIKDDLTGLYQKNIFTDLISQLLNSGHYGTFAILDIDNFKSINDTYGHMIGDQCLKSFGAILDKHFSHTGYVSRYGGDEFEIFIEDCIHEDEIKNRFDLFTKDIQTLDIHHIKITCSIGIVIVDTSQTFNTVFERADHVLYETKDLGKNSYCIKKI